MGAAGAAAGLAKINPWALGATLGLGVLKTGFGMFQAAKASRGLKNIQRPQYQTPESLTEMGDTARQLAYAKEMPGQKQTLARIDQAQAEGVYNATKFATSSGAGQATAENLATKKMQAIQDLGGQFAEYKYRAQQNLQGVLGQEAEDQRTKFQLNEYDPYQVRMNELTDKRQQGWSSIFGGADSAVSGVTNLVGTRDYLNVLRGMNPKFG